MKIKTTLTRWVGFLFALIIVMCVVGGKSIHQMKQDTGNILKANYNTLLYVQNMLRALQHADAKGLAMMEENLNLQENNITEEGELEVTLQLREQVTAWQARPNDTAVQAGLSGSLLQIMAMNLAAIERKSQQANATADRALILVASSGALCFLLAMMLFLRLPSHVAKPIEQMAESIRRVAEGHYAERVHFPTGSELAPLARSFNSMAEKLEEYNHSNLASLMLEKKRIETLIHNISDPVIGLDEHQTVVFVNKEAAAIIGLPSEQINGYNLQSLALHNDLVRMLAQGLDSGLPHGENLDPVSIYANNKESYFEKIISPIAMKPTGEEVARHAGHVIILKNVTHYKELDFAKTNFIANLSHEFKTPISSIKMSLQLLSKEQVGPLNQEQVYLLTSIGEDANTLLKTTGELLNITQLESGAIQLALFPTNPDEMFHYAASALKSQAEQKQIRFEYHFPAEVPQVMADSEKIAWVLTNLISNAIRYSHEHSVIRLLISEEQGKVILAVSDQGQGIAPKYLEKIFDRYFRVPGSSKEGTGLGLAISKEFIEAQGGEIKVESELGVGSTFTISLKKALR